MPTASAVREVIADLSSVWGGRYMPIFDIAAPIDDLKRSGNQYDVDSLYADTNDERLGDLLREAGWAWNGRGPWGPFGDGHGFHKGLLPTRSFLDTTTDFVQPSWDEDDPARAAEKLGGPFSGVLNQPAIRAALTLAAGRLAGVTLPHLWRIAEDQRGSWPDPLFDRRMQPDAYARRQVDYLWSPSPQRRQRICAGLPTGRSVAIKRAPIRTRTVAPTRACR